MDFALDDDDDLPTVGGRAGYILGILGDDPYAVFEAHEVIRNRENKEQV